MNNRLNISQAKPLLESFTSRIPEHIYGSERLSWIAGELLEKMSPDQLFALRDFLHSLLFVMRETEASDIEIGGFGTGGNIWFRCHGIKSPISELGRFNADESGLLILSLLTPAQRSSLAAKRSHDFAYVIENEGRYLRYRANAYYEMDTLALNMRAIGEDIREWDSYRFSPLVQKILNVAHLKAGLILVTGLTGSGKSSTLDAIVNMNNESYQGHIVIISSPIEYVHGSKKCLIRHREVGRDTRTFRSGIIESMRQDPDIIVVGEMRDPETIYAALEAADTGHKVFSTLHTSSAIESLDRVIAESPAIEQERVRSRLADVLKLVITQKLVPSIDGKRVLAKEILILTPSVRAAIRNNNTSEIYQMINEGGQFGMATMEQDLRQLFLSGKITKQTAMDFANNSRMMHQMLSGMN